MFKCLSVDGVSLKVKRPVFTVGLPQCRVFIDAHGQHFRDHLLGPGHKRFIGFPQLCRRLLPSDSCLGLSPLSYVSSQHLLICRTPWVL